LAENIRFDAKPALFFDGRNLLNGPALQEIGFVYQPLVLKLTQPSSEGEGG
jgi:hypothetical protein